MLKHFCKIIVLFLLIGSISGCNNKNEFIGTLNIVIHDRPNKPIEIMVHATDVPAGNPIFKESFNSDNINIELNPGNYNFLIRNPNNYYLVWCSVFFQIQPGKTTKFEYNFRELFPNDW